MSVGVTMQELLAWNKEAAKFWKAHLEANPALLEVPCTIGNTGTVQGFVRHVWGAEVRDAAEVLIEPSHADVIPVAFKAVAGVAQGLRMEVV